MDYTNFSQPWEEKTQVDTRIPVRANARFFYAHNPENWELKLYTTQTDDGKKKKTQVIPVLLPVLSSIPETPGVNGTRAVGGRLDSSYMRTTLRDNGWTILDASQEDYLRVYPAHKGNYYTSKWIGIEKVGRRVIEHFDQEGYDNWRLSLMTSEKISIPHPKIASLRLIGMNRALSRLERDQHIPEVLNRLKSKQDELAQTKKAIARIEKLGRLAYELR